MSGLFGGSLIATVIIFENGIGEPWSNPRWACISPYVKSMTLYPSGPSVLRLEMVSVSLSARGRGVGKIHTYWGEREKLMDRRGGMLTVTVTVVGNKIGNPSKNSVEAFWNSFCTNALEKAG